MSGWFEVDRAGLAEIAKRRGVEYLVTEPIQNAWDEKTTRVSVSIEPVPKRPLVDLVVEDDSPDGFRDLADAYTLFAPSYKLDDPEKRGRFNVGEKLLLAVAEEARISTTTGTILFGPDGRKKLRAKTERGSVLWARIRMTREEMERAIALAKTLIPPPSIETVVNGEFLPTTRALLGSSLRSLDTEVRGEEGGFLTRRRVASVEVFEVYPGETPSLYEMGIPIDEISCPWHVNVTQKVPLSVDRGSVRLGYRDRVEAIAAEIMADAMTAEQAADGWVSAALAKVEDDYAVRKIVETRFGGKAVTFDPNAPESNKLALDAGYVVVHGSQLSRGAWEAVRRAEALTPSSRIFPDGRVDTSPDGVPPVPRSEWTAAMARFATIAESFARHVLGHGRLRVLYYDDRALGFEAFCGSGALAFNLGLSEIRRAVEDPIENRERLFALLIHETAHDRVSDHLTHEYHRECCRIGARAFSFEGWK